MSGKRSADLPKGGQGISADEVATRRIDRHLQDALVKAYIARSKLFHSGLVRSGVDLLIAEIDAANTDGFQWPLRQLGISPSAFQKVRQSKGLPHQVFAHPDLIAARPYLIAYYRNIATISQKGISQIGFPTGRFERSREARMDGERAAEMCRLLNGIISGVIDLPCLLLHGRGDRADQGGWASARVVQPNVDPL